MSKQLSVSILALFFFLSLSSLSFAEYRKVKAVGTVETKFIKTATTGQKKQALDDAKKKALDKYISNSNPQKVKILNNLKEELYKNIDTYVPEIFELNSGKWENGYWKVDVEASIDESQIEALVTKFTQTNIQNRQQKKRLTFVFVARSVESATAFKGRETNRQVETEGYKESEAEKEGESAGERTRLYEKTTGGSVKQQSDKLSYALESSQNIESNVTEIFNNADFSVIDPIDAGFDRESFNNDFSKGDEISAATRKAAIDKAREKKIDYLAIGTLNLGQKQIDSATGMVKVSATFNGFVLDTSGEFAERVCSVVTKPIAGLAENQDDAKANALINAGTEAAKQLVDQVRAKQGL